MISILPEHAPPSKTEKIYKLIVADDVLAKFKKDEAILVLNAMAEEFVKDMGELQMFEPMIGKIDEQTLDTALNFMVVTEFDEETLHDQYTSIFHKLVKQKFYWKIV